MIKRHPLFSHIDTLKLYFRDHSACQSKIRDSGTQRKEIFPSKSFIHDRLSQLTGTKTQNQHRDAHSGSVH